MSLTEQQTLAIAAEGNVLVMAGAGTGKTSTLVARVADRLARRDQPVSADRLLMVTFTEAAAAEMRSRLRQRLEELSGPGEGFWAEQLARLELASIGTLHAFCLGLLREHGMELGLEPQVAVLDEVEAGRLARTVWGRRVEGWLSDEGDAGRAFRGLVEGWFDSSLASLWGTVRELWDHARTLEDPERWLTEQERFWSEPDAARWRQWHRESVTDWARDWHQRLEAHRMTNRLVQRRLSVLQALVAAGEEARGDLLDALVEDPTEYTPRKKTVEKAPLEVFFGEAAFLRSLARRAVGPEPVQEDWDRCRGAMQELLRVVRGFGDSFQQEKRLRSGVDFSDLEQWALELLMRRGTTVSEACRARYEMVVVDECQDLNAAQEAILRAVSRDGAMGNRFLVGDVKQSIYRFRLADPRLFQETARLWSIPGGEGRVIPLTGNFRSAQSLLGFVNRVCRRLLREEVGGVGYGPDAELQFGAPTDRVALATGSDGGPRVDFQVRLVTRSAGGTGADEEDERVDAQGIPLSTAAAEARLVAARFLELKEEGLPVWDRGLGRMRPVEWSDMAVLLRSERGRAADYVAEFRAAGIPLVARQAGFFEVPVVADLRNLLRVLDNPLQDIPLLAVLRSPLVGLGDVNALVAIRSTGERRMDWWTRLLWFRSKGREVATGLGEGIGVAWDRVDRFLTQHAAWRQVAIREGAAMALETALDATGYEAWAARAGDGGVAVANVRRFLEMARRFDRGSRGGLYRFLVWLENEEAEDRTEPAGGDPGSAVRLMTVHRSKGLEFPVVAVSGLGMRFQMRDLTTSRVVRDDGYGLCPLVMEEGGRRYPSLPLWVAQRRLRRELLGEELRLLYVALTRAADHLVMVGSASEKAVFERWLETGSRSASDQPLAVADIEGATSPMDWLGPVLAARAGSGWGMGDAGQGDGFEWKLWRELPQQPEVWMAAGKTGSAASEAGSPDYPHQAATQEPAKVTATGLRRRMAEDPDGIDIVRRIQRSRHGESDPRDGTAVERGMAHHRFMEGVRLDQVGTMEGIRGELERMLKSGWMEVEEGALVDLEGVVRFWGSELGQRIRERAGQVRREVPFTARLTGADLGALGFRVAVDLGLEEYVVAQGVVDLAVIGPEEIWILDFKTDRVGPGAVTREKAATYRPQLAVYALALARIHGKPVTGRWLHFLATGETVEV